MEHFMANAYNFYIHIGLHNDLFRGQLLRENSRLLSVQYADAFRRGLELYLPLLLLGWGI